MITREKSNIRRRPMELCVQSLMTATHVACPLIEPANACEISLEFVVILLQAPLDFS